jgi:hypothetical protein
MIWGMLVFIGAFCLAVYLFNLVEGILKRRRADRVAWWEYGE